VLTISRLSRWSINYYNDTANAAPAAAMDRQSAGGGLGEYYSERDTRMPTWIVAVDTAAVGELTGLDAATLHGGFADTTVASRWLDDGIAPNGASGRVYTTGSVHGFDLTFAAPKSVSLLRALTDDIGEKTGPAAVAGVGGNRLPARDLAVWGSAPAHPRHRAQPPGPNRWCAGIDRLQVALSRSQSRRHRLSSHPAPRAARRAGRGMESGRPIHGDGPDGRRRQALP